MDDDENSEEVDARIILRDNFHQMFASIPEEMIFGEDLGKIDGVISIAADVPLTVATIANELSLPGISLELNITKYLLISIYIVTYMFIFICIYLSIFSA